jgi:hypothetical protein
MMRRAVASTMASELAEVCSSQIEVRCLPCVAPHGSWRVPLFRGVTREI